MSRAVDLGDLGIVDSEDVAALRPNAEGDAVEVVSAYGAILLSIPIGYQSQLLLLKRAIAHKDPRFPRPHLNLAAVGDAHQSWMKGPQR